MKSRIILVALALMGAGAWAADPVAVWDRDFTTMTQGTYTLSENGNTKTDTYLQISGDNGILVTSTDALNVFTVLMRCEGLDLSSSNNQVLFTSNETSGSARPNLTGIYLLSNNETTKGIWNGADWSNESGATKNPVPANYTTLIYNHQQTNGTYAYALGPTSDVDNTVVRTTLYSVVGLRSSGSTYKGCAIGGLRGTTSETLLPATGLKITSLAVFSGTLTETEMKSYIFPSEIQTINVSAADSIAVSEINNQIDANAYKTVKVVAEDGATITVDEAFSTALPIAVSSTGSITLSAESQPDASYFTGVDFSGVQGGLLRSWLTPGVVGFNFNSANGTDTSAALVVGTWQSNASDASGSADLFGDGLSAFSWGTSLYQRSGASSFLDGYIDDAWSGNGATITLSNVPYETYDVVIYASTDSGSVFTAKTVNGTAYTWNAVQSAAVQGAGTWGSVGASSAIYGVNSLRIKNLSGPLTIYGGSRTKPARGGIAAIQIMPPTAEDIVKTYTLTLDGTATTWSAGTWTLDGATVSAPTAGNVAISATASTTLTIDADVTLGDVTVNGDDNIVVTLALGEKTAASGDTAATYYSFYANKVAVDSGVLQQGSSTVLGTTPAVAVADGATFDLNGLTSNGATVFYLAGDGAGNWPYALTSSSGEFSGTIKNMYLTGDAAIGGEYKIVLGANWDASYCYLQNHTLVKTGTGELLVRNWNIPDDGTVIVRGGELHTDQWNCLNKNTSGTVTLKIEADGTVRGTNQQSNPPAATTLYWEGTLNTASRTFIVKSALSGGGTTANLNFEANATANLKRDLTITASLTLSGDASFLKSPAAASGVTVSVTGTLADAATGTITVGAGVTLNLGINRPAGTLTIDDAGALVVQMASATDIVELKASAQPANITLYDENGTVVTEPRITYSAGTLTIAPPLPTLVANGLVAFDTEANWDNSHIPTAGEDAIIELEGDAEVTVANTYTLGSLTITGAGVVSFAGEGSITATTINLRNGATLVRKANISATAGISIDAGTVLRLDGVTENAAISGAGAVETYGAVTFNASNTFTGGLTVKSGSEANTIKTEIGGQAYGKNNYGQAIANLSRIVVEDGGSLDLANTANACYAITISGKGVYDAQSGVYKGALYNSGPEIGQTSRQTASLTLAADAMVKAESSNNGWGIVNSSYAASVLALNGHTLTVSGVGYFPIVNANTASGTQTTGTLIADGVTLGLVSTASNLTGVDVIAKGCATINLATAPTALGSLTLKPSATGTTASSWNLPSGCVPTLDTSNVDPEGLSVDDELTLFTAPSATVLTAETIAVTAGGRYTTTISGYTVTATVVDVLSNPFIHYDFNAANAIAADSRYNVGNLNPALVNSNKGKAGTFDSTYRPYYGSNSSNKSPFYAGEMSVMSLIKIKEANNTILWNLGNGLGDGIALIAKDAKTVALVSWTGGADGSDVVAVAGESDITNAWHLVTIVADGDGTTLYVDDQSATVDTVLPNIGGKGQFGSIHGTAKNYNAVAGDGYLLDDWRIYDAALTADEIATFREDFLKTVTITVPKVDHTTVTVGTAEVDVLDVIDHGDTYTYTVITGATVKVSYTSDDYEVTGGEFEFAAADDYTVDTTEVTTTLYVASVTTGETTTKYTSIKAAIDATSGGAATITVLTASSENLTIPADTRVAIEDASGLFTGDITVKESGILDLSNRTAADCVACTNLTLAAGAGLWLPEGVTGSVKVAENLIADALVDVKIGDAYTQTFTVASSDTGVLALRALRATAKPVAVWNADFGTGAITRGGFTLDLNNGDNTQDLTVTNDTAITIGAGAAGGVRFMREAASGYQLTAIARINTGGEVDVSATPVLFSLRNTRDNNTLGVGFGKDGYLCGLWDGVTNTSASTQAEYKPEFSDDWLFVAGRFWSMAASDSTSTHGTYGYWDGNQAVHDLKIRNDSERVYGVTLGGLYADNTKNLAGAQIDYVAIFDSADETLDDGVPAWSLANMTTVETLPATATALAGGSTTGFNLSGGTITIDSQIMAAAVFVQEDTTLKFTGSGSLTIANNGLYFGPVYVAEGKTLTIDASESEIDASALIHGAIYGNVAIDATTSLAYIADDGLYRGGWPSDSKVLTIVVNGDAAITGGDFTGLKALTVAGAGTLTMTGCALEADEFTLGAGVSLTLDEATHLSAPVAAIGGTLTTAGAVTNTTLTVTGTLNATNVIATTVEVAGSMAIAAGGTLEATTLTVAGEFTTAGTVTVPTINVTGTLTAAGEVTATTVNALGESFTVAAGGNLTVNGDRGLSGTVTVEKDGTLTSGRNDAMNYDGSCTVHLYGQLDFAATRWTLKANNRIYLYEGCEIWGTGDSGADGAVMDLLGAAVLLNVTGNVTIDNNLRIRGNANIYVNDNSTLTLNGLLGYAEAGQLIKSGGGTMAINGASTSPGGLNAYVGTIKLGTDASVAGPVRVQAQGTLDVAALASPVIAGAVTLDKFATVAVPDNADLAAGVQLTTLADEGALTVNTYATLIQGATVNSNASVQVLDNNKLAMVAQSEHVAAIVGDTTWADISWTPALPADPAGRKLIINVSQNAAIDGGTVAKTAGGIVFNVAQNCMLSLTNLTLTADLITVNGGMVKVYGADTLTGEFVGNGTVIYDGVMPASPAGKFTGYNWRGTLHLKDLNTDTQRNLVLNSYGNTQSTIKLEGVNGYFAATVTVNPVIELAGNGLDINNGNSGTVVTMPVLKGNGTLTVSGGSSSGNGLVIRDCSGWIGSLDMTRSDRYRITFGESGTAGDDGKVIIAASRSVTIADGVTWTTVGGIENNGNLAVEPLGVISGPLVNNGTITLSGTLSGAVDNDNGTITVTGADANLGHLRDLGNVVLSPAAGTNTVTVWQTRYEYLTGEAQVTNIADATIEYVVLMMLAGDEATAPTPRDNGGTADTVTFTLDVHVDDDASWYSFPFNEAYYNSMLTNPAAMYLPNNGYATGQLQLNKVDNYQYRVAASFDVDSQLLMYASPFFSPKYPENFSVALSATLPATANNVLMSCGKGANAQGSEGYLALIRGEADDEVLLVEGNKEYQTTIAKMRAFNADKVNHLYVFAKEGNKITVYLDGAEVISKQLRDGFTIGNGFQIGQLFGGNLHGSTGVAVTDTNAKVRLFRIYEIAMTQRMIDKLSEEYPVILPDVRSVLTLNDANQITYWYDKEGRWEQSGYEAGTDTGGDFDCLPQPNAKVTLINETSAQTLKVNLNKTTRNADSFIYSLTVQGTKELAIGKPMGGHCVYVSTVISNEAPLTVTYGALDMLNARLEMTETATLTFDLTDYLKSLDGVAGSYPLTGKCQKFGDGQVTITYDASKVIYSSVELKYDTLLQQYCVELGIRDNAIVYLVPNSNPITLALGQEVRDGDGNPTLLLEGDTLEIAEATPGAGMVILEADIGIPKFVIPEDATLEVTYEGFTNAVAGAGRIRFKGRPKAATKASFQNEDEWTGLVEMIGIDFDNTGLDNYVNASSTLRLIGCTAFPAAGHDDDIAVVLKDTDEDEARDYGYGLLVKGISDNGDHQWVKLTTLLGDGALVCTNAAAAVKHLRIRDTSGFTGNLYNQVGETGGVGLVLGATATDPGDGSCLEVQADAVLNLVDLVHAETNLVVIGTNNVTRAGALVDCPETIFDGGTLRIGAPGAYPVFLGKVSGTALQLELADGLGTATRTIMGARDRNDLPEASLIQLPDGYALSTLTEDIDDGDNQFHTEYYYVITRPGFYIRIR